MANGVDALRQEIAAAKTEVKDDLRHESAARDSVLQSTVDLVLETMQKLQTENRASLDRHEADNKAALAKFETDNSAKWAKYEADNREAQAKRDVEQAKRDVETEKREKRLVNLMVTLVLGAMGMVATVVSVAGYVLK